MAQNLNSRTGKGVRVDANVSNLKPEAIEMLDKIKEMKFKNPLVQTALSMQIQQNLSDFETMILLCYHSLDALSNTQEKFIKYMESNTRPMNTGNLKLQTGKRELQKRTHETLNYPQN